MIGAERYLGFNTPNSKCCEVLDEQSRGQTDYVQIMYFYMRHLCFYSP